MIIGGISGFVCEIFAVFLSWFSPLTVDVVNGFCSSPLTSDLSWLSEVFVGDTMIFSSFFISDFVDNSVLLFNNGSSGFFIGSRIISSGIDCVDEQTSSDTNVT